MVKTDTDSAAPPATRRKVSPGANRPIPERWTNQVRR